MNTDISVYVLCTHMQCVFFNVKGFNLLLFFVKYYSLGGV